MDISPCQEIEISDSGLIWQTEYIYIICVYSLLKTYRTAEEGREPMLIGKTGEKTRARKLWKSENRLNNSAD